MIHYSIFSRFPELLTFTTTKDDLSDPLPRFSGRHDHKAEKNRQELAQKVNILAETMVFPEQQHTANIIEIDTLPVKNLSETDALVSRAPGICLCIQTADCVPVLLYDPANKVIGAVHAGWRGTLAEITSQTVSKMIRVYSCKPGNIHAAIGPSIGPDVYETGKEVVRLFTEKTDYYKKILSSYKNGRYHLNLWKANELQLLSMGVSLHQIENSRLCTYTNHEQFFSARHQGIETGRIVSGIMMHQ